MWVGLPTYHRRGDRVAHKSLGGAAGVGPVFPGRDHEGIVIADVLGTI
jgi:hypothetical protein